MGCLCVSVDSVYWRVSLDWVVCMFQYTWWFVCLTRLSGLGVSVDLEYCVFQ